MNEAHVRLLQNRIAQTAVGPSALRNQGGPRVVARTREFLGDLDLSKFATGSEVRFYRLLDAQTKTLRRALPPGARNWGTARKALNLFLRDVLYNRYLCPRYRFARIEAWLEVPLDSYVAEGIRNSYLGDSLPKWPGVKHLTPELSASFQSAANRVALAAAIARVHLDLHWWRP